MPYILMVIGAILATAGFYRFFLRASSRDIKTLFLAIAATGIGIAAIWLTLTGRLPVAIAILTALWPIAISFLRNRTVPPSDGVASMPLNAQEAYEILGLEPGANEGDIREAHARLMKKVHPDVAGSDWLAQKINAARDLLLKP